MKKLFNCEVVCLALSVLGMYVMYACDTECVYMTFNLYNKYYIYSVNVMHTLAYIALGCICLMALETIVVIIMEKILKVKKNK